MQIMKATDKELDLVMKSRFEMLRVVNHLSDHAGFEESFQSASRDFFQNADQTTILALEDESKEVIGCASICYLTLIPTFAEIPYPEIWKSSCRSFPISLAFVLGNKIPPPIPSVKFN